jgi:hypothetical protein
MVSRGKGATAPGKIKRRSNPQLEPTLPNVNTHTKEASHGNEEKGQEKEDQVN